VRSLVDLFLALKLRRGKEVKSTGTRIRLPMDLQIVFIFPISNNLSFSPVSLSIQHERGTVVKEPKAWRY
jgi:hypothetical protein